MAQHGPDASKVELPKPKGRPTKLTDERKNYIVELIKNGNYIEVACAAAGIDQRTYYHWVAVGKTICETYGLDPVDEDTGEPLWPTTLSPYEQRCAHFYQDIRKATAEAEATAVLHIRKQFPDQWAAAMTFLERRFPGRWKRRDELQVQDPFNPAGTGSTNAIDETALLNDPEAVRLMHEALAVTAARGRERKGGEGVIEGHVAEIEDSTESTLSDRQSS